MRAILLCCLVVGMSFFSAYGEEGNGDSEFLSFLAEWDFKVTHYFWWASEDGDITATDGSDGFSFESEIDISDFAGINAFEAWRGNWGFAGHWVSADFEDDIETGGETVEVTIESWVFDASFGYSFAELSTDRGPEWLRDLSLYAGAGLRYWNVTTELDFLGTGRSIEIDEDWVEPFLVTMLQFPITSKVVLSSSIGVGGFGTGNSDDPSWHYAITAEYLVSKYLSVSVGYAAFDSSYSVESGDQEISVDSNASGMQLAVRFSF